jgi:membrane-associated phospholipid phosphatase
MRDKGTVLVVGALLALGAACVAAFLALVRFFVRTEHGQKIDTIALTGTSIGQARIDELVNTVLDAMSVVSLAFAAAAIAFIALARRRRGLALAVLLLIAGANVTTQVAKHTITRPYLGVDIERAAAGNSLPSGHTTVAASVAIALILVLPPRVRAIGAMIAAGYAALAGVATMSAGWHRPSDAMAALMVVGGWTAAVCVLLLLIQRRDDRADRREAHPTAALVLIMVGTMLLLVAAVAMELTEQVRDIDPEELGRRRLFAAYAGGAAGISGTAGLVIGLVLLTVHRVVPQRVAAALRWRAPAAEPEYDPEPPTVPLRDPAAEAPTVRIGRPDDPTLPNPPA